MRNYKYKYEVYINNECYNKGVEGVKYNYTKWFDTQKQAIAYTRSIKKHLKQLFSLIDNNTISIDINQYINDQNCEKFNGIVYSINLVGRW